MRDKFSTTSSYGNAKLTYPVALITADEVALAGGKYNTKNENYYLRDNYNYWTMTSSRFLSSSVKGAIMCVVANGQFSETVVDNSLGIRPVINIRSDILISSGDGTVNSPYQLKLK